MGLRETLEAATPGEWWVDADEENLDARAVRDALERLREERDAAEKYRQGEKRRREAAEAEVRRLTEGLRDMEWCEWGCDERARALLADSPDGGGAK